MSTARLNVWITRRSDPCHIDDKTPHFVHIVDCEGKPLHWCGRTYSFLCTKCGHLEVDIPPGCYAVFASETPEAQVADYYKPFGNQLTHIQIVRANCGDHVCVTLFAPSFHFCGTWWSAANAANRNVLVKEGVDAGVLTAALEAGRKLLAEVPADPFSANIAQALQRGRAEEAR